MITDLLLFAILRIDLENGNAIGLQPVARIEETTVQGEMDVSATLSANRVGGDDLDLLERPFYVSEYGDRTAYLTHGIDRATVTGLLCITSQALMLFVLVSFVLMRSKLCFQYCNALAKGL